MEQAFAPPDLTTTYLGLELANPVVASASPLSEDLDNIRRMEDAGAAAVVMHSLFEEQLMQESHRLDRYLDYGTESFAEALSYFPDPENYQIGPDEYLEKIRIAAEAVDIPVIGSLNGISTGGWTRYAREIQQAGADALELNIYYLPTNPMRTSAEVEDVYTSVVRAVRSHCDMPLAVKLGPFFSSPGNIIDRITREGAQGVVLFNRFYQPDIDVDKLEVVTRVVLSTSNDLLIPIRWTAILYGRISADIALSGGVHNHIDVVKAIMAGARVAMMTSELLVNGIDRIRSIITDLTAWMTEKEYSSIDMMRGSMSQLQVAEPTSFERANYMKVLQSW